MTYKGFLASSEDPTQLSLTVQSSFKMLIGLLGWYATAKGFNAADAQTQMQAIEDTIVQLIPLSFATYHALITLWGLIRKVLNTFRVQPAQN